jgi:hypothetical protein
MPIYCYRRIEDDELIEIAMSNNERERLGGNEIEWEGKKLRRDIRSEHVTTTPPSCWPLESEALGVLPDQKEESEQFARDSGIPTEFVVTKNGMSCRPKFVSRRHKRDYLKAMGYRDNNGGYSD